jgi:hypothetical protein
MKKKDREKTLPPSGLLLPLADARPGDEIVFDAEGNPRGRVWEATIGEGWCWQLLARDTDGPPNRPRVLAGGRTLKRGIALKCASGQGLPLAWQQQLTEDGEWQ